MGGKSDLNTVPNSAIASLLDQGVSLGFFHTPPSSNDLNAERDDVEMYKQFQKDGPLKHSLDINCQLIEGCPGNYYSQEGMVNVIINELNRVGGRASKFHLCQTLHVKPVFLEANSTILKLLPLSIQVLGTDLISDIFWTNLREAVLRESLEEPVVVAKVCTERSWDVKLALDCLVHHTKNEEIKGEIHMDTESMNLATATFTPSSYTNKQQDEVANFLEANGFISKARALRHGLSLLKIEQLAKERHQDVIILEDFLIAEHTVLQKLQASIELCIENGISDLQEYIPAELIRQDIIFELLKRVTQSSNQCIPVICKVPLVQSFAKAKAEEIIDENRKRETDDDEDEITNHGGKKNKSRSRKQKEKHSNKHIDGVGVVPLQNVAQRMIDLYTTLTVVDADVEDIASLGDRFEWEDENDSGFLLIEFCKCILYTDAFQSQCQSAVLAELKRLESAKISKSCLSRKEAATKIRNVDSAFEDCFTDLCYLIQASSKFHLFASGYKDVFDVATVKGLQNELLLGYCADLTSRITQYCLYKNEEEPLFTFKSEVEEEKAKEESLIPSLPPFCMELDFTATQPIRSYLSCPPPREPLPVLRECLDSNKGVTLARQWILCGGESYRGGVRISEEGSSIVREGTVDGFLNHVQENCLTLCGLPFKKLDKKAEKQLLFRRKVALMTMLEETTDPAKVLNLTIMLLFQQVKHMVVYGKYLRGSILNALVKERKISESVGDVLQGLNDRIEKGLSISEGYLNAAKGCALCKDIGKHEIDFAIE
ncbi:unnamed protein product [Cylindrotheca closterium]|uniref:Uncharacterized protein n=1 Tax=Cylindrotheca closterium TaxID=2856 RepID=A0AAD2G2G0_9STRA|nr:unnamed protein product [Cylindrotheca closterium]